MLGSLPCIGSPGTFARGLSIVQSHGVSWRHIQCTSGSQNNSRSGSLIRADRGGIPGPVGQQCANRPPSYTCVYLRNILVSLRKRQMGANPRHHDVVMSIIQSVICVRQMLIHRSRIDLQEQSMHDVEEWSVGSTIR